MRNISRITGAINQPHYAKHRFAQTKKKKLIIPGAGKHPHVYVAFRMADVVGRVNAQAIHPGQTEATSESARQPRELYLISTTKTLFIPGVCIARSKTDAVVRLTRNASEFLKAAKLKMTTFAGESVLARDFPEPDKDKKIVRTSYNFETKTGAVNFRPLLLAPPKDMVVGLFRILPIIPGGRRRFTARERDLTRTTGFKPQRLSGRQLRTAHVGVLPETVLNITPQ